MAAFAYIFRLPLENKNLIDSRMTWKASVACFVLWLIEFVK